MIKINRSTLEQSKVAGGAAKFSPACPAEPSTPATPTTGTQSGAASSTIIVNGQTVVSQTVTF